MSYLQEGQLLRAVSLHPDNFNPVRTAKHRPLLQLGINNKWVAKSPRGGHSKSHSLLFAVCCFVQLLRACKNSYHAVLCCTSLLLPCCNGLIKAPTGGEVMPDSWSVNLSVHHKTSSECCMGFLPGLQTRLQALVVEVLQIRTLNEANFAETILKLGLL